MARKFKSRTEIFADWTPYKRRDGTQGYFTISKSGKKQYAPKGFKPGAKKGAKKKAAPAEMQRSETKLPAPKVQKKSRFFAHVPRGTIDKLRDFVHEYLIGVSPEFARERRRGQIQAEILRITRNRVLDKFPSMSKMDILEIPRDQLAQLAAFAEKPSSDPVRRVIESDLSKQVDKGIGRLARAAGPALREYVAALKAGAAGVAERAKESTRAGEALPEFKSQYPQIEPRKVLEALTSKKTEKVFRDVASEKTWNNIIVPAAKQMGVGAEKLYNSWKTGAADIRIAIGDVFEGLPPAKDVVSRIKQAPAKIDGAITDISQSAPIKALQGISNRINKAIGVPVGKSIADVIGDFFTGTKPKIERAIARPRKPRDPMLGLRNIPDEAEQAIKIAGLGRGPIQGDEVGRLRKTLGLRSRAPKRKKSPLTQKQVDSLASQGFDVSGLVSVEAKKTDQRAKEKQAGLVKQGFAPGSETRIAPSMRRLPDVKRKPTPYVPVPAPDFEKLERDRQVKMDKEYEVAKKAQSAQRALVAPTPKPEAAPSFKPRAVKVPGEAVPRVSPGKFQKTLSPRKLPKPKKPEKLRFGLKGKRRSEFTFAENNGKRERFLRALRMAQ